MFTIELSKEAALQILELRKVSPASHKKLKGLLKELEEHPYTGTGHPEKLRHQTEDTWSRRIDKKNRLIYSIHQDVVLVFVLSVLGHYNDK